KRVLSPLNYNNLDVLPEFKNANTTAEFLTKHIYELLSEATRAGKLGRDGRELTSIRVTLSESHVARAWYEAPLWWGRLRSRFPGISTARLAATHTIAG